MSDSVGKITLDLEIASDIGKQINAISNSMGKNLKDTLNNSFKSSFDGINKSAKDNLNSVNNTMKSMLSRMKDSTSKTLSSAFAAMKKIKLPTPKFPEVKIPKPKLSNVSKTIGTRGPPTTNKEILKSQIEGVERTLDNTNAKIEQQQAKLAGLREEYNNTFNQARKNKLEEQILKTEEAINKLIATSDKLGFKLADLDSEFKKLGASPRIANAETTSLTNKTKAFTSNAGKAGNSTKGFSQALKQLGFGAKTTGNNFRGAYGGASMFFSSLFKWGMVFPLIIKGITSMAKSIGETFMTNQQFANSLAQIKTNLMVAFTPIFYAVLPAVNALMSALSTITTYIAMFTSALFGKTYQASYQATQGLINAKEAMGDYGTTAKKAGKDAKGALAGFDEINVLAKNKHDGDSGGGAKSKVPKLVSPGINTAPTSAAGKSVEAMLNNLKAVMATLFNPLKAAWQKDGSSVMSAFKQAIDGTKNTLKHLYEVLKTPPVQLFIENVARIGLALVKLALSIYNNFILPMTNWFISKIPGLANGLNPLLEKIRVAIEYVSGNKNLLTVICSAILGVIAAIKALEFSLIVVSSIKNLGIALNVLATNPIVLVIAGIAALVIGFTALYASNEKFRECVNNSWNKISKTIDDFFNNTLKPLGEYFINGFVNPIIGALVSTMLPIFKDIFNNSGKILNDFLNLIVSTLTNVVGIVSPCLELLKKILLDFLNIIKNLWDKYGIDLLNNVSNFLKGLKETLQLLWDNVLNPIIKPFLEMLSWLWDKHLKGLVKQVGEFVLKCVNGALELYNGFIKPLVDWLVITLGPTFSNIIKFIIDLFGTFIANISDIVKSILKILGGIIDFIVGVFTGDWKKAWRGVIDAFSGIADLIGGIFKAALNVTIDVINFAIKAVIEGINGLIQGAIYLINRIPGVDINLNPIKAPHISKLATGGVIDSPTLAMVGEAGKEAVVPLENNTGWIDKVGSVVASAVLAAIQFNTQSSNNSNNNTGDSVFQLDGTTFARLFKPYADAENQRIGNSMIIQTK
ncbi:hypothetical protein SAMN02745163_03755 [Clostridium cavendishii DSM 21758]|uniref:Phage-related protein n=1 Tax=Clostridium cavendishii DSM 21758 TaxID=1121302 RepID=A0A1M6S565_9CLOT|nr:hypothetical protein [Clostridium cavendishii]SHK39799.1 hypothetical protein SAMN02745163_03755 [Clostridium cavendishii DSM 21758]